MEQYLADNSNSYIYLAAPYSHKCPAVRVCRFLLITKVTADLIATGLPVYSPITYSHPMAVEYDMGLDWEAWEKQDRAMITGCSELWVLTLDGWSDSHGVQSEISIATKMGKPVKWITPNF